MADNVLPEMRHSSQKTRVEYENKHEKHIAAKMANVWEQKIGTGKVHTSPVTVVGTSGPDSQAVREVKLTKAGSVQASNKLERKRTKEIVDDFENMTKSNGAAKSVSKSSLKMEGNVDKGDIYALMAKLAARIVEMDDTLKALKAKVDAM